MVGVITEFNFKLIQTMGTNEYIYILADSGEGHRLRVFSEEGKATEEAIKQLKGMIICLENLKKLPN